MPSDISAWTITRILCPLREVNCCGHSLSNSAGIRQPAESSAKNTEPDEAVYEKHDHAAEGAPASEPRLCGYRPVCGRLSLGKRNVLRLSALRDRPCRGMGCPLALPTLRQTAMVEFRPALQALRQGYLSPYRGKPPWQQGEHRFFRTVTASLELGIRLSYVPQSFLT